MKKLILILLSAMFFASCEDVIDVDLEDGKPQLTVDAILSNLDEPQYVRLTMSGDYFDVSSVTPVTDALVELTDSDGNSYTFKTPDSNGKYELESQFDTLVVGREYFLKITHNNEVFTSKSPGLS
ncbi:MAG: DUF4249 family protein [Candidatus Kapaibacterium sp.]